MMNLDSTVFNLKYTAYIDAVKQPLVNPVEETRRPENSSFHVNYYQEFQLGEIMLEGAPSLPTGSGDGDNVDTPTVTESHLTIDDETVIQDKIINFLMQKVNK
jgi:hypothetical protein